MDLRRILGIVSETLKWLLIPLMMVGIGVFVYVVYHAKHPR